MARLDNTYLDAICELKTFDNRILATTKISDINFDYLEVKFLPREYAALDPNTVIKLAITNVHSGYKILVGKVYVGTNELLKLVEVVTLEEFEKRNYYRVGISQATEMFKEYYADSDSPTLQRDYYDIRIADLSLSGLRVISKCNLMLSTEYKVCLDFVRQTLAAPVRVKRVRKYTDDMFEYGCEFDGMRESHTEMLYKYIHKQQMERIKKI